jgi:hypothetical protein
VLMVASGGPTLAHTPLHWLNPRLLPQRLPKNERQRAPKGLSSLVGQYADPQAGLSDYGFSAFNANAEAVWHAAIKVRTASGEYARVYMIVEALAHAPLPDGRNYLIGNGLTRTARSTAASTCWAAASAASRVS